MRKAVRNDAFSQHTRSVYREGEPTGVCAVCGGEIWWPEEEVGWTQTGDLRHAECEEEQ